MCLPRLVPPPGTVRSAHWLPWEHPYQPKEFQMPVILWLLGVPLTIIVLLMLFGVL
jgi:hypothetical protein